MNDKETLKRKTGAAFMNSLRQQKGKRIFEKSGRKNAGERFLLFL